MGNNCDNIGLSDVSAEDMLSDIDEEVDGEFETISFIKWFKNDFI